MKNRNFYIFVGLWIGLIFPLHTYDPKCETLISNLYLIVSCIALYYYLIKKL